MFAKVTFDPLGITDVGKGGRYQDAAHYYEDIAAGAMRFAHKFNANPQSHYGISLEYLRVRRSLSSRGDDGNLELEVIAQLEIDNVPQGIKLAKWVCNAEVRLYPSNDNANGRVALYSGGLTYTTDATVQMKGGSWSSEKGEESKRYWVNIEFIWGVDFREAFDNFLAAVVLGAATVRHKGSRDMLLQARRTLQSVTALWPTEAKLMVNRENLTAEELANREISEETVEV